MLNGCGETIILCKSDCMSSVTIYLNQKVKETPLLASRISITTCNIIQSASTITIVLSRPCLYYETSTKLDRHHFVSVAVLLIIDVYIRLALKSA